jgi:hypothetical protein
LLRWRLCSPRVGVITPDTMASVHCDAAGDALSSQSQLNRPILTTTS